MVARISTGKSLKGVLNYNEQKVRAGQAELLLAHRFLQEPHLLSFHQKLQRFERLLEKNPRVRTNAVHISLNFAPGEVLHAEQLQAIATAYMEKLGFAGQPFLVYRHLDAAHPHIHLVTTNIRPDGKRIDLHNIGRHRSETARKEVEQDFGLVKAAAPNQAVEFRETAVTPERARYGVTETKRTLARIVSAVTRQYNYTSLAELNAALQFFGVVADQGNAGSRMHRNRGLVFQLLNEQGQKAGVPIKASALPGKPTLASLEERFAHNRKTRQLLRAALKQEIDRLGLPAAGLSRTDLARRLGSRDIAVLFRENRENHVYGVTFVDHRRRAVFNGSELGKAYSAKALTARFSQQPLPATEGKPVQWENQVSPSGQALQRLPRHAAFPELLQAVLQPEMQPEYVPRALHPKKKKRRRRGPTL
jgi:hypothetical protein